jgi:hypothetical protein
MCFKAALPMRSYGEDAVPIRNRAVVVPDPVPPVEIGTHVPPLLENGRMQVVGLREDQTALRKQCQRTPNRCLSIRGVTDSFRLHSRNLKACWVDKGTVFAGLSVLGTCSRHRRSSPWERGLSDRNIRKRQLRACDTDIWERQVSTVSQTGGLKMVV